MTRFCAAYQESGHPADSATVAGYSAHSADVTGGRLLRNIRIRRELARLRSEALASRGIDRSYVITALLGIVEDRDVAGQARVRAIELLGKDLGMFVSKSEQRTHIVVERATPRLAPLSPELEQARLAALTEVQPGDPTIVDVELAEET